MTSTFHALMVFLLFLPLVQVVYPDAGPVMLLSESSIGDLSSRLENEVTAERFRPNIVISDCEAFEEVLFFIIYSADPGCVSKHHKQLRKTTTDGRYKHMMVDLVLCLEGKEHLDMVPCPQIQFLVPKTLF